MSVSYTAVETVSGRLVDLANPVVDDVEATDIAWALSREPRFGGHTITSIPYSVGQHSLEVSRLVNQIFVDGPIREAAAVYIGYDVMNKIQYPKPLVLFGLLHDASEAYLRDLPSPVKMLPGMKEAYGVAEAKLMGVILEKFGVSKGLFDEGIEFDVANNIIHWADLYARTVEAYHFMPSRGLRWNSNQKVSMVNLQQFEQPREPLVVYHEFLMKLQELLV